MEWAIVMVCLMIMVIASMICCEQSRKGKRTPKKEVPKDSDVKHQEDYKAVQKQRDREKEAHYMRNFWNYDGSEQHDWDEEV